MQRRHCGCAGRLPTIEDAGPARIANPPGNVKVSYLSELRLDLGGVSHPTPGMAEVSARLTSIVSNCYGGLAGYRFCTGGNTRFDARTKFRITQELKRINQILARARAAVLAGNLGAAAELVGDAIRAKKQRVLPRIPGIEVDESGVCVLPFFPIYDLFVDIDHLVDQGRQLVDLEEAGVELGAKNPSLRGVIARLKVALQELAINLIRQPWFDGDDAPQILDRLKRRMEALIRMLERFDQGEAVDASGFGVIEVLKKEFLDEISDALPLWETYSMLKSLDGYLSGIRKFLLQAIKDKRPLSRRRRRFVLRWLDLAEGVKGNLERVVKKTPFDMDEWILPLEPKLPEDPKKPGKPSYLPGQEDLPPFPPPGHA